MSTRKRLRDFNASTALFIGFFTMYILVGIYILIAQRIAQAPPFAARYVSGSPALYMFLGCLPFLPVYFVAGFLTGVIFHIDRCVRTLSAKAAISAVILILPWLAAIAADNPSFWSVYSYINPPHGWAMSIFTSHKDYQSPLNLFFTALPPICFVLGIFDKEWMYHRLGLKR